MLRRECGLAVTPEGRLTALSSPRPRTPESGSTVGRRDHRNIFRRFGARGATPSLLDDFQDERLRRMPQVPQSGTPRGWNKSAGWATNCAASRWGSRSRACRDIGMRDCSGWIARSRSGRTGPASWSRWGSDGRAPSLGRAMRCSAHWASRRLLTSAAAGCVKVGNPRPVARWRESDAEYLGKIGACEDAIVRGRRTSCASRARSSVDGRLAPSRPTPALRAQSPSHHGALLRIGGFSLLSAWPERFSRRTPTGSCVAADQGDAAAGPAMRQTTPAARRVDRQRQGTRGEPHDRRPDA